MKRKYELTNETLEASGHTLYRIRALRDFGDVKAGDLGGFVDTDHVIAPYGDCWVTGDARVYDNTAISGNAKVSGNACIFRSIWLFGNCHVCGDAYIFNSQRTHRFISRRMITGNFKVNSGIWDTMMRLHNRLYLVSTTLKKLLLE